MKTVIEMMRESHLDVYGFGKNNKTFVAALERYTELVRADEREACAQICLSIASNPTSMNTKSSLRCCEAIRARGDK